MIFGENLSRAPRHIDCHQFARPCPAVRTSVSVRRSYLDYLIRRIDPDAAFVFGFVDTQAKVSYDLSPRHKVSMTTIVGRGAFKEGDPDIEVDEIRAAVSRAWLISAAWRYLPNNRLAITQRLYSTGLRFDNENRDGAPLDAARSSEFGWRADASLSLTPRLLVEFGGDAVRLDGRSETVRQLSPAGPRHAVNAYDERASAASAYGQIRLGIGSRITVTTGSRIDRWTLTDAATASPWATLEFMPGHAHGCTAAAACTPVPRSRARSRTQCRCRPQAGASAPH